MKKFVIFILIVISFCSCKTFEPPLYYWSGYEDRYYDYYKKHTPESCGLLYESYLGMVGYPDLVKDPNTSKIFSKLASRKTVPPGICAEYGYMLLNPDTPNILKEYYNNPKNFPNKKVRKAVAETDWDQVLAPDVLREKGLEMLQKETELYPESATFIEPLIKKLSQQ